MKNFYLKRWDEAVIWKSGFCRRVKYIYFFKFKVKTVNWKGSIEALILYISREGGGGDCIVKLNIWIISDSVYLFQYMIKQNH